MTIFHVLKYPPTFNQRLLSDYLTNELEVLIDRAIDSIVVEWSNLPNDVRHSDECLIKYENRMNAAYHKVLLDYEGPL